MRLLKQRKQERIDRRLALSGVPILNDGVNLDEMDGGGMRVSMTVKRGRGFFERFRPPVMNRSYELDEFGGFVLEMVDGERSVLDIINAFQERFPMSRREVELSVVAFFKMLMQRNVVSIATAPPGASISKGVAILLMAALTGMVGSFSQAREMPAETAPREAETLAEIRALSEKFGAIAPGTEGNLALEEYVAEKFKQSGFETGKIVFEAPAFESGTLQLDCGEGGRFILDAMHPTLMRPGNFKDEEFETRLVYLGKGGVEGLKMAEGTALDGALAVMEYDSGDAWFDLLRFGIRGVIFIGNGEYVHYEAVSKVFNSETSFPRFFIDGEQGEQLRTLCREKREVTAEVVAAPSRWRRENLRDLWVLIPGTDETLAERVIVFTAPVDANSVVPARAYGGQRMLNLHLLMKLLDDFRANPPPHSVLLVAVNAHTQKYAGERMLAWHLLADETQVEGQRDRIAEEMREARLFKNEYGKLQLKPVPERDKDDLHVLMEIMWVLDRRQQEKRRAEHQKALEARAAEIEAAKAKGKDVATLREASQPRLDKVLELSEFDETAVRDALAQAKEEVLSSYDSFFAKRGRDPDVLEAEKREDSAIFKALAAMPFDQLMAKLGRVKHVFDDEKLFEAWRSKLDESTGQRIYIKSKLQDEFKGRVNKVSMEIMATSRPDSPLHARRT